MALKVKVATKVTLTPVPKILARTALAGEVVKTLGGSAGDVETAQKGIALGVMRTIAVYGVDRNGAQRERLELNFDDNDSGDVYIDTTGGKSVAESLDAALAQSLSFARRQFEQQGLETTTQFEYRDSVYADPARLEEVRQLLGTMEGDPPEIAEGYEERQFLTLRPGKDPGSLMTMTTTRRPRGGAR